MITSDILNPEIEKDKLFLYEKRVIVAGTRNYNQYEPFCSLLEEYLKKLNSPYLLISGDAARGPDAMVIQWAKENNHPFVRYKANWNELGKAAGVIRNAEMEKVGTHLLAFWDCQSTGTLDMIRRMHKAGKPKRVVLIYNDSE